MVQQLMSLGETARALRCSEATLRRWDAKNILRAQRNHNGARQYLASDVEKLKARFAVQIDEADLSQAFRALAVSKGLAFAEDLSEASTTAEPKLKLFSPADVAGHLGISLDLLTTWTDQKLVATVEDPHGVPMIDSDELDRVKKALDANQKSKDLAAVVKAPGRSTR